MSWARGRVAATVFCVVRGVRVLRRRAVLKSVHNHLYRLNVSVRNILATSTCVSNMNMYIMHVMNSALVMQHMCHFVAAFGIR